MVWCEDPAPSYACDPADAVKYIRADKHQEIIDRQARAAKMGMDAAKKSAEIMERNAKQMRAESSPEVVESERAANAVLTDRVEQLTGLLSELFLAFPPIHSKEQCDLMKRVSREIGGEQ
jgi:hypothetical protein